jgi:hypothetical protein
MKEVRPQNPSADIRIVRDGLAHSGDLCNVIPWQGKDKFHYDHPARRRARLQHGWRRRSRLLLTGDKTGGAWWMGRFREDLGFMT